MKIYLVQHGKPVSKQENSEKPLSDEGRSDIKKMAAYLKRAGIRIDAVYNSGKTRARQTAEILGAVLVPEKEPEVKKGLGPLDDVKLMFDEIRLLEKDIIIVGHLPHLEKLTSLLVTGGDSHSVVRFQQGGVVCITSDEETEKWHIAWMQIPGMVA